MPKRYTAPIERAARALCESHGQAPGISFEGRPLWMSCLEDVNVVLRVALGDEAWAIPARTQRS